METISLHEAQYQAQQSGLENPPLTLISPGGKITKTFWEDPFMGAVRLGENSIIWFDTLLSMNMKAIKE